MKVAGTRLEDFVDWTGIISSEPAKEEKMSRLAARFAARMCKRTRTVRPPLYLMGNVRSGLRQMKRLRRTRQ